MRHVTVAGEKSTLIEPGAYIAPTVNDIFSCCTISGQAKIYGKTRIYAWDFIVTGDTHCYGQTIMQVITRFDLNLPMNCVGKNLVINDEIVCEFGPGNPTIIETGNYRT